MTAQFAILLVTVIDISTSFSEHASASFLDDLFGKYKNYENVNYDVKLQYPKDWTYNETGYDEMFPDRIFNIIFLSPSLGDPGSFSVSIQNLKPSTTTLDEYKNRIALNLKNSAPDVKDLSISPSTLTGNPAYSFDYMIRLGDAVAEISIQQVCALRECGSCTQFKKLTHEFEKNAIVAATVGHPNIIPSLLEQYNQDVLRQLPSEGG